MESIAQAAGVAASTVSRALRGDPRISESTRQRILELTSELGYRPNPLVSALMAKLRNGHPPVARCNLAWIDFLPTPVWQNDRVQQAFFAGARQRAKMLGYAIDRVDATDRPPHRVMRLLRSRGISGVIMPYIESAHGIAANLQLPLDEITIVGVGARYEEPCLHYCSDDQYECARLAVRKLWCKGYRRIGYVAEPRHEEIVNGRFRAGHEATLQNELGGPALPPLITTDPNEVPGWLRDSQAEAIVTANRHLLLALRERGLKVPQDVAFAHLNVDAVEGVSTGEVAGVCQNNKSVGANAVELLVSLLYHNEVGVPLDPRGVQVRGKWIDGRSAPPVKQRASR